MLVQKTTTGSRFYIALAQNRSLTGAKKDVSLPLTTYPPEIVEELYPWQSTRNVSQQATCACGAKYA